MAQIGLMRAGKKASPIWAIALVKSAALSAKKLTRRRPYPLTLKRQWLGYDGREYGHEWRGWPAGSVNLKGRVKRG
jgi:hypothetical protein